MSQLHLSAFSAMYVIRFTLLTREEREKDVTQQISYWPTVAFFPSLFLRYQQLQYLSREKGTYFIVCEQWYDWQWLPLVHHLFSLCSHSFVKRKNLVDSVPVSLWLFLHRRENAEFAVYLATLEMSDWVARVTLGAHLRVHSLLSGGGRLIFRRTEGAHAYRGETFTSQSTFYDWFNYTALSPESWSTNK